MTVTDNSVHPPGPDDGLRWFERARIPLSALIEALCWPLAGLFTDLVEGPRLDTPNWWVMAGAAAVAQLVVSFALGTTRQRYVPFSFEEVGLTALSVGIAGTFGFLADLFITDQRTHAAMWIIASAGAFVMAFHYLRRARARWLRGRVTRQREPVVIIGAGEGGVRAIQAMLQSPTTPYRPVALLDDDPSKRQRRISGVRVEGSTMDLADVADRHRSRTVLLAIPSAGQDTLRRLHRVAEHAGLQTLVLPPVQQLVGRGSTSEMKAWRDEDVLQRRMVSIDMEAVRGLLQGRRVLVTGAGGSIGSELCRQIAACSPDSLVLFDHDDSLLHAVQRSLGAAPGVVPVLGDVRDAARLDEAFLEHRPELVFHAAALKHVPALEHAPAEGWKTNVLGSRNVLATAERHGVARFVNISTDKAAEPINVLGRTKRLAEMLTAATAARTGERYVSVRFGNVIGSRGSVLETFQAQIDAGGPVTVTDRDVTRYFMAVREAVRLTLQAATMGAPGEVLVLDMGAPVRIDDVARQLVEQSGKRVDIVYTGLRPGEKLHEVLLAAGEQGERPHHPLIDHVTVTPAWPDLDGPFSPSVLDALVPVAEPGYAGSLHATDEEART